MSGPAKPTATVLVVDDDRLLRMMLSHMLKREGYGVETAAGGQEALDKVRQAVPDLITLDYMMPDMNGAEVLEHLAAHPTTAAIPVLIISAVVQEQELQLSLSKYKPIDFLAKPFSTQQLLTQVQALLPK